MAKKCPCVAKLLNCCCQLLPTLSSMAFSILAPVSTTSEPASYSVRVTSIKSSNRSEWVTDWKEQAVIGLWFYKKGLISMFNPGRGLFLFPGVRPANQFGRIEKEKESSRLILKSPVTNLETEFLSSIPRNPRKEEWCHFERGFVRLWSPLLINQFHSDLSRYMCMWRARIYFF